MDATALNIEMCKKAKELQNSWERKHGDYYYDTSVGGVNLYHSTYFIYPHKNKDIWLPTQDQLQEIAFEYLSKKTISSYYTIFSLIFDFSEFAKQTYGFDSMDQLWLIFVMKEKFGKIWNGKDWIVEK